MGCSADAAARARALPPVAAACAGSTLSAAVATASLAYVARRPQLRKNLREMTDYLRQRLAAIGLVVSDSPAPIVSFEYGNRADMQALQRRAFDRGLYLHYSNYIGAGLEGMIRCAVFCDHTREDVEALVTVLS